jgi:hypothetical protein
MKFGSGKPTTLIIAPTPSSKLFCFDEHEEDTLVAPPPRFGLRQRLPSGWYERWRSLLLASGGLFILVAAFFIGSTLFASSGPGPSASAAAFSPPERSTRAPSGVLPLAPLQAPWLESAEELDVAALTATVAATAPAPLASPDTILLSVTVSPASAQVTIGDRSIPSNPFVGRFPKSPKAYRIRAAAPGFQAREREVSFGDDVILDFTLAALPEPPRGTSRRILPPLRRSWAPSLGSLPAPAAVASASLTPVQPSPPLAESPAGGHSSRRTIESKDPYAEDNL